MVAIIDATAVTTQAGKMPATMVDDYATRLQTAMDDAKVSVVMLAEAIGLSRQAVKKVLDGPSTSFKVVPHYKAARFLKVRPEWLALGELPMRPEPAPEPADTVDWRTLMMLIAEEHPDPRSRDLLLQACDLADGKAAQIRQRAAERAKAHTL